MDKYKFGTIDVMFPVVENLCEIITLYANVIDKLALGVSIDTEKKSVVYQPYVQGEEETPKTTSHIGAFGSDIYQSRMPQEALLIYFYDATMMLIKEGERDVGNDR